jgi:3-hydroxymyristoyl/3-hydroxydecanoyl-(acyl carrier protein) dehydratase
VEGYRPIVLSNITISDDGRRARATVATEAARALCAGHFPGDPFVPGAYVADWMVTLSRQLVPGACVIERCAFIRKVEPESAIEIEAELGDEGHVRARVIAAAQLASTAKLRFTSEASCRVSGG